MRKHILVVDDDNLMRRSLAFNLEQAGFSTSSAATAEEALLMARVNKPDLVLLDIGLAGMDGLDALKQFKRFFDIPVIFVTARRRELDEVVGLELGADDYVTKPFDIDVLLAHIKAVLRRTEGVPIRIPEREPITLGDISIDPVTHLVTVRGITVKLTPREFDLLYAFMLDPNKVISVDDLLSSVWGAEFVGQPQVVYVHVRWLREKIEEDPDHPQHIITVRGVGYRFLPKEAVV
jgi:DNA-binding response OmpR family regulator